MYKKYWLLIQETDEHGHHAAYIRPVTSSDNIASICKALPSSAAANIYPTKKAADNIARLGVGTAHIHSSAYHLIAGRRYYRILLRVYRTAQLVSLASRDTELVSHTEHKIRAVLSVSGSAVVARRDDTVVLNYYCTVALAKARASLGYGLCYIEIIIML